MLDARSVSVYKYVATNSREGVYRGRISDIVRATGLSRTEVLRVLSLLEQEKYIQVIYSSLNLPEIFRNIASALLRAEAGYVEALRGLTRATLEEAKKAVEAERSLGLKYLSGTEYEELLAVDVIKVLDELAAFDQALARAFSYYVNVSAPSGSEAAASRPGLENSVKFLKRLDKLIDVKDRMADEDILYMSTALSVFIEIPKRRRVILKSPAQQIMKSIEDLRQSLEEIEVRMLIEGATPELTSMRAQIESQLDSLVKLLATLREEREVYFVEKSELPRLLDALNLKEAFLTSILSTLKAVNNPSAAEVATALSKVLELLEMERAILSKLAQKVP
jgi:DNA-binding transcriptional regulator GbsR (MarR family)